jgi:formamidopyrimidine-DNA glycosylase
MPELPEVEITARRLSRALAGAELQSVRAPGMVTMKTFDPPLTALEGGVFTAVRRRGKMLVVEVGVESGELALLVHLMSAGRMQLHDKPASGTDRTSRLLLSLRDGRELRLREFGTRQRAWAKLLPIEAVDRDEAVSTLGPDAWPAPPQQEFDRLISQARQLHPLLRDQRTIAGIGRSWVDEILWTAALSPFRQGSELSELELERLRRACDDVLGGALAHYEQAIGDDLPDKLPMPLKVHRRQGNECPRCGAQLEAVHFKDYVMTYCPREQTGNRVLKDRRLSRLLR